MRCGLILDKPAVMQKNDVLREPARLSHIMSDDNHLYAAVLRVDKQPLDGERRGRVEASGRLVEKQDVGIEAESASKA